MIQTKHQEKLKRRNERIITDYERIMCEEEGATIWKVANYLSVRYNLSPNMVVKIVKSAKNE